MAVRVKETTFDNYAYHQVGYLHPEVIGSGKRRVPKLLAIGGRDELEACSSPGARWRTTSLTSCSPFTTPNGTCTKASRIHSSKASSCLRLYTKTVSSKRSRGGKGFQNSLLQGTHFLPCRDLGCSPATTAGSVDCVCTPNRCCFHYPYGRHRTASLHAPFYSLSL